MRGFFRYKEVIFLGLIVLAGLFLRFGNLSTIPSGFYVDEAAIGYNSYSMALSGKDEFGKAFPIFLRSYSAYSSPLYMYLTTPVVYFFGLSVFSVRAVSAISGTLSIVFIYLFARNLFPKDSRISLATAVVFAFSPWSIFFSRAAFEGNLGVLLLLIGLYFLTKARQSFGNYLVAGAFFGFSTYAYQPLRLVVFIVFGIGILLSKKGKARDLLAKQTVAAFTIFIAIQLPMLMLLQTRAFTSRATGLFYGGAVEEQTEKLSGFFGGGIGEILAFAREFGSQYVAYFNPRNLFFLGGADPQRSIPEMGPFFEWMVLPYVLGLIYVFRKQGSYGTRTIVLLLGASPLAAALTRDPFSTLRAIPLLIPLSVVIAVGVVEMFKMLNFKLATAIFLVLFVVSGVQFWRSYFVLLPNERASAWDWGYRELAEEITKRPGAKFVIDETRANPAYIHLAFNMAIPPEKIQGFVDPSIPEDYYNNIDFDRHYRLLNFETRGIDWEEDIYENKILVGDELAISKGQAEEHFLTKVFEIWGPDKKLVWQGYETNPGKKCESEGPQNPRC